jgi:hypothetical protein
MAVAADERFDKHDTQRLQPLRYFRSCSGCFGLERVPGGVYTHWKSAAFARRTPGGVIRRHRRPLRFGSGQYSRTPNKKSRRLAGFS